MRSLLVVVSYHHKNTEKIAQIFAKVLDAEIKTPRQINPEELKGYELIGFDSGIYSSKHHQTLIDFAGQLPEVNNKKAFIFSTCGAPAFALDGGQLEDYISKSHAMLREILQSKGYIIVDEFNCAGWNTNKFLKIFGGINKGRPNIEGLRHAEAFAHKLLKNYIRS